MSKQEYKTMRVPEDDWKAAEKAKGENETWGEYLRRCTENPPEVREFVEASGDDLGDVSEQLDRIESSTATVEERTGQIQRDLEDLGR